MTNDEIQMSNEIRMKKHEAWSSGRLAFRCSSFVRHLAFDIRHSGHDAPCPPCLRGVIIS